MNYHEFFEAQQDRLSEHTLRIRLSSKKFVVVMQILTDVCQT